MAHHEGQYCPGCGEGTDKPAFTSMFVHHYVCRACSKVWTREQDENGATRAGLPSRRRSDRVRTAG